MTVWLHSLMPLVPLGGETICLFCLRKSFTHSTDKPPASWTSGIVTQHNSGQWFSGSSVWAWAGDRSFPVTWPLISTGSCFAVWWCCHDPGHWFFLFLTKNILSNPLFLLCVLHLLPTLLSTEWRTRLITPPALLSILRHKSFHCSWDNPPKFYYST